MKALPFTIPKSPDKSVIIQEEVLPYFYPYFHRHDEIQLTWVQRGEGTLVAGDSMHVFSANEIYLLGPNMPHVFKSDPSYFVPKSKKRIYALTLFFNPNGKLLPLFELPEIKQIQSFLQQFQKGFKVPPRSFSEISARMMSIKYAEGFDRIMCFFQLLKSLHILTDLKPLASNTDTRDVSDFEGIRIGRIYNYIMQHYDREITLEEIAAIAHMTPPAFCRYFKKHTRHTFISFLNEVRINEACKKLTGGNYESIGEVAYKCGFNNITHFNRVFKQTKGKPPKEYIGHFADSIN